MKLKIILAGVIVILLGIWFLGWNLNSAKSPSVISSNPEGEIKYVAIGDSYTIGLGVSEADRWPNVLTSNLKKARINIKLIANPAVSGYRVQDAIIKELPIVQKLNPDFVTVLIGANDNFGNKDVAFYKKDLKELLDKLQPMLRNPKNIVLITIPDYAKSPAAVRYDTAGVSKSIESYNQVIKTEAAARGLKVADIFPLSQTMTAPKNYIGDELHPSAEGYQAWEKVIFPVVFDLLKNS